MSDNHLAGRSSICCKSSYRFHSVAPGVLAYRERRLESPVHWAKVEAKAMERSRVRTISAHRPGGLPLDQCVWITRQPSFFIWYTWVAFQ